MKLGKLTAVLVMGATASQAHVDGLAHMHSGDSALYLGLVAIAAASGLLLARR